MPEMTLNIDTGSLPRPYNKRGVCSVCGAAAYDGRATKCADHKTGRGGGKSSSTSSPGRDDPITFVTPDGASLGNDKPPSPPPPIVPPLSGKAARAEILKRQIQTELNPLLVKGFALSCRPIPEHNFYTVSGNTYTLTDLGKTAPFADWEAEVLGKFGAELESMPVVKLAGAAAAPVMPYLVMVAGVAVVGFHGYQLIATRDRVLQQWAQMEAQNRARQAQGMDPNAPPDAEPMPPSPPPEAQGEEATDDYIDAEIVSTIPPVNGNGATPPEAGQFADLHVA